MIKQIITLLLVLCIITPCIASEQVTFTVKDRYFVYAQGLDTWTVFIDTIDGRVYYDQDIPIIRVLPTPPESMFRSYEKFAPNTTHTVQVDGHKVVV